MTHWVIRFGYEGQPPTELVEDDRDSAIVILSTRFELENWQIEELDDSDRIELGPEYTADFCEIEECDCSDADNHG